ncbi:MAG: antitoxin family protein [Gammaproteobacteria bacterium]|nr:antitoxin family protein [Gammaproteobacteria bacterium]NNJ84075.1 antitoxin family protein [Gammaproteobacteria bacterium]
MYQAIEAICRNGVIQPLEPITFEDAEHLVILRLSALPSTPEPRRVRGAMKDMLTGVDAFIAAKRDEIAKEEHR